MNAKQPKQSTKPLSPTEANDAVRALRNLIMTFDKSGAKERISVFPLFNGGCILTYAKKKKNLHWKNFID